VCNTIISFEGEGRLDVHTGNYSNYLEKRQLAEPVQVKEEAERASEYKMNKPKKLKLSFKEQLEYDEIDDEIGNMEELIRKIEAKMEANSDNYVSLQELMIEKEKLDMDLLRKYQRWEYLNELVEKIKQQ
jgi:ATP-binding cassette subfamily F protein uup